MSARNGLPGPARFVAHGLHSIRWGGNAGGVPSLPPGELPQIHEPGSVEVRVAVRNAVDADYIEERVGGAFYTHLRGAETTVDFLLRALVRAYARYKEAAAACASEPEVAGFALLVVQRVFLARTAGPHTLRAVGA